MSAFMVNKGHVAAILAWYTSGRGPRHRYEKTYGTPQGSREALATMLHAENAASVNYRYSHRDGSEVGHEFTPADFRYVRALSPVEVIKACHCLVYQSCEHPGWEASEAKALLDRIQDAAVRELPGYEEAEWEVEPINIEALKANIWKQVRS